LEHKIVRELADPTLLDHLLVDDVNSGSIFLLIVVEDVLDVTPGDLLLYETAVFDVEDNLLYRDGPMNFGVFYGWLADQGSVAVVMLHFVDKRAQVYLFVSKCV
jgi:hypothetical protein